MKLENQSEPDDALQKVLQGWEVKAPLPPRFREQVWQRIALEERQPKATAWINLSRLLEVLLPRPQIAIPYLAGLMIVGVLAGTWSAQSANSQLGTTLGRRYVQSLDPFWAATHP